MVEEVLAYGSVEDEYGREEESEGKKAPERGIDPPSLYFAEEIRRY